MLAASGAAPAETALGRMARHFQDVQKKLGPRARGLSSGAQTAFRLIDVWQTMTAHGAIPEDAVASALRARRHELAAQAISRRNLLLSRLTGFTQSETSTAWCGGNVVSGFNDSGSLLSGLLGIAGMSIDGFSVSSDAGSHFTYRGGLAPADDPNTTLSGDPALICQDSRNFLYASLFEVADDCSDSATLDSCNSGVSVSRSSDGGRTFSVPIEAVRKDGNTHLLDKDWIAIDPKSPRTIFITYTDFDFTMDGSNGCPANSTRTAIELVSSTDGGTTWSSSATEIDQQCTVNDLAPYDQGSQVVVDPASGRVYVAWERFGPDFFTREIDMAFSTDRGASFSTPTKVADVHPAGDGWLVMGFQGNIRNSEYPSLAVGKGARDRGALYLVWNDGDRPADDLMIAELSDIYSYYFDIGTQGTYNFADVMFTASTDQGMTWSAPVRVNSYLGAASGSNGWDAFRPAVASDKTGAIGVCWYDRRADAGNFLRDRFCARSTDRGASWSNRKITSKSSPSLTDQDWLMPLGYDGDYDSVTSDFLNRSTGFIESYSDNARGNPNVSATRF